MKFDIGRIKGAIAADRKKNAIVPEKKQSKSRELLKKAGHELKKNPPATLEKTAKKKGKGQAEKQRVAIMFSKARKEGARV